MSPPPGRAPPASPPHWPPPPSAPSNGGAASPPLRLPIGPPAAAFACGAAIGCGGEAGGFPLRAAGIPVRRLVDSDSCSRTERPARPGHRPGPAPTATPTATPPGSPRRGGRAPLPSPRKALGRPPARWARSLPLPPLRSCREVPLPALLLGRGHLSSRPGLLGEAPACASGGVLGEPFKGVPARDVTSGSWGTAFPLSSRACTHKFSNGLIRGT